MLSHAPRQASVSLILDVSHKNPKQNYEHMNISFDGKPVRIHVTSEFVVLADVAALEGLRPLLPRLSNTLHLDEQSTMGILNSSKSGFEVYVHKPKTIKNGLLDFTFYDLEEADEDSIGASVDTGSLILFDFAKISEVCSTVTWEAYDFALQDAGTSRFDDLTAKVGGPFFAIIHGDADADHCFHGDGKYRIKSQK